MLKVEENVMLAEAKLAKHKPKVVLQILIFIAVMIVIQMATSVLLTIPMFVWVFTDKAVLAAIASGDALAALNTTMALLANMPDWVALVTLFATIAETLLAILYCKAIEKRSLRSMGFSKAGWTKDYLLGFGIGAGMLVASVGIAAAFGTLSVSAVSGVSVLMVLAFLAGFIVQGMAEEVLLRGYFMVSLANRTSVAWAVAISSAAFSLLHLLNAGITLLAMLNLTLFGVFMGIYVLRAGNIWGACALHTAWNFFQGNIFGVQVSGANMGASVFSCAAAESGTLINGGAFGLEGGLAVTAVLAIAICAVLLLPRGAARESAE